ncbi:hypothetical protein Leryth_001162 [Lithospermum erythrorhizon]|nr:hypothetical protein Leryth_001162 [Lithospermum erythrorhizon]
MANPQEFIIGKERIGPDQEETLSPNCKHNEHRALVAERMRLQSENSLNIQHLTLASRKATSTVTSTEPINFFTL